MSKPKSRRKTKPRSRSPFKFPEFDDNPAHIALLAAIKSALPELEQFLGECDDHWGAEDKIYRFYRGSFKVYVLQELTEKIVELLRTFSPSRKLDPFFEQIIKRGTGVNFEMAHNKRWFEITAPFVEAFFHTRYFLEMAIKYGRELERPPTMMPSGWAALLCLYDVR